MTEAQARPKRKRPWPLEIVVALIYLSCLIGLIDVIGLIMDGTQNGRPGSLLFGAGLLVLVLGLLIINIGVCAGANWARITMMIILALVLLQDLTRLLHAPSGKTVAAPLFTLLFLGVLNLRSTRQFCGSASAVSQRAAPE